MIVTRYDLGARVAEGRRVLEVACGAGQGLGYMAERARWTVGGDYHEGLLGLARRHYGARVPLVRLDAQRLPFTSSTFDVIVLHEAIYYLELVDAFVSESRRVLREDGALVVSTVNREWPDFNPSPESHRYLNTRELRALLETRFRRVSVYGAFPIHSSAGRPSMVSLLKRLAVRLGLIPKTMKGKRWLKRLFYGLLVEVPAEITDDLAPRAPGVRLEPDRAHPGFKLLLAVASNVE